MNVQPHGALSIAARRLGGWGERPAPLRGAGALLRGGTERGAGRVHMSAAPPPRNDPIRTSDTYEGDGGVYARRYHDQEHVNESGHRRGCRPVVAAAVRAGM